MNTKLYKAFAFFCIGFWLFVETCHSQTPLVHKVEPPSWWANHSINPVRLLIRGERLFGARVRATKVGVRISDVRVNPNGNYVFVNVTIAPNAKAGDYPLQIETQYGKTKIPFAINAPLDVKKNFQGITNDDVIYLIMTDRFANGDPSNDSPENSPAAANDRKNPRAFHGGDFRGVINRLSYLKELGITAIWLTPWYDNPNGVVECPQPWCPNTNYHGYHAIDYYGVEDHFGTMKDLQELVEKAHALGIKVIQDQVANHVGIQHVWAANPPLENWFSKFRQNSFNNSALLSPNSSEEERRLLLTGWFNELLPDMNQYEPEVARYEIQNALWWIGMTGIDGIRQDTIQYMPRKFISDWSKAILRQYPKFWMVGEVFERDSAQTAFFMGGHKGWDDIDTNLPSVFDFKLWDTSCEVFTGKKPIRALRDVLKYDGLYPNVNNITTLTNNHDTKRFMSLEGATLEGAMLHTAFMLSIRGIPQLYAGEEILMEGSDDPFNRNDFPGGWKEDSRNAFTKEGRTANEQKMFEWTRDWIRLRRLLNQGLINQALNHGREISQTSKMTDIFYDNDVYLFTRGNFIVAFNNSSIKKKVSFPSFTVGLNDTVRVSSRMRSGIAFNAKNGKVEIELDPKSAEVFDVVHVLK